MFHPKCGTSLRKSRWQKEHVILELLFEELLDNEKVLLGIFTFVFLFLKIEATSENTKKLSGLIFALKL